MVWVRWVLPALIFLVGIGVIVANDGSSQSVVGGFMFIGAAAAVLLINVLWRIGVEGEVSRDREEAARRYFDAHGHWPDERPRGS
jgi:chromate transport protein ChrA